MVDASIRYTLGHSLGALGDGARASKLSEQAYELRRKHLGEDHPDTIDALALRAAHLLVQEQEQESIDAYRRLLNARRRHNGSDHLLTLDAEIKLISALQFYNGDGRHRGELEQHTEGLLDRATSLGASPDVLDTVRTILAGQAVSAAEHGRAVALLEEVLEARRQRFGEDHPRTMQGRLNVGTAFLAAGEYHRAIAELERVVPYRTRVYGAGNPMTLYAVNQLIRGYRDAGRLEDARGVALEALRTRIPADPGDASYKDLANLCAELGIDARRSEAGPTPVRDESTGF